MNTLAEEGLVLFVGPLATASVCCDRRDSSEADVRDRLSRRSLAADPTSGDHERRAVDPSRRHRALGAQPTV
jgi:hypothetical protein